MPYIFFELDSRESEVASAAFADYTDIASDSQHLKAGTVFSAGVSFFHFEDIADLEFLNIGHGFYPSFQGFRYIPLYHRFSNLYSEMANFIL